jgi:hypothetical protein
LGKPVTDTPCPEGESPYDRYPLRRAGTAARLCFLVAAFGMTAVQAEGQSADPLSTIAGTWRGPVLTDGPSGIMTVAVVQEAGTWKTTTDYEGDGIPPAGEVRDFKVEGNVVTWAQSVGEFEVIYRATEGDMMKGTSRYWAARGSAGPSSSGNGPSRVLGGLAARASLCLSPRYRSSSRRYRRWVHVAHRHGFGPERHLITRPDSFRISRLI